MRSRLNPDSAKIRALRIQRGWTQEQLAEIAGVSTRTIQRAETAGCAAFDSLRAVAGAFETDFNQLLKSHPRQVPDPEPHFVPPLASVVAPIPECCETVSLSRPARPVLCTWTTLPVAAAALAAGLLTGGIFVYLFYTPAGLHFPTPRPSPAVALRAGTNQESRHHDANTVQVPGMLRTVSSPVTVAAIPNRESERVAEKLGYQNSAAAAEVIQVADLGSQTTIPASILPASFDLPLTRNLMPILATAEVPGGWNPTFAGRGDFTQKDQGNGAVRQAIEQATKKTSEAIAKAGASMKRVF